MISIESTVLTAKKSYYDMIFHCQEAIKSNGGKNIRFDEDNVLTAEYRQDRVKVEFQEQDNGKTTISIQCKIASTLQALKRDIQNSFLPKNRQLTAMKVPQKQTAREQAITQSSPRNSTKKKVPPCVHSPRKQVDDKYLKEIIEGLNRQNGNRNESKGSKAKHVSSDRQNDSGADDDYHHDQIKEEVIQSPEPSKAMREDLRNQVSSPKQGKQIQPVVCRQKAQKAEPPKPAQEKSRKPNNDSKIMQPAAAKSKVQSKVNTELLKTEHHPYHLSYAGDDDDFISSEIKMEEQKEKQIETFGRFFIGGLIAVLVILLYFMFH